MKKKIISMILVSSLILISAIPAFAAEVDSNDLEKAITQVKSVITIPSDYKDFQYSSSQYEEGGKTVSIWSLEWKKEDYRAGITATVEADGTLINYNKYDNDQREGLGTVTRDAGQKTAAAFLAKARPDLASAMRLERNADYSSSDDHRYQYQLYQNDTIVNYVGIEINVDKYTGEVTQYHYRGAGEDFSKFPSTDGVIGLEAARKAYLEKIGVSLKYYSDFNYDKKRLTIFPAYTVSNAEGMAIDAKTGEAVPLYDDYRYYAGMSGGAGMSKIADASVAENALTREELAAVENISNVIPKETAESILRSRVPGITSEMKVSNASLSKNYIEPDKYLWEIGFDGAYGVVNAKTEELVSFYVYNYDEEGKKTGSGLTEAKAKEKAESFIKQVAPEKFSQSKFYERSKFVANKNDEISEYSFNYYRQVNGIDFVGNGFSIIVDKATGLITSYDCNWYDGLKFPSIDNVITNQAAFDVIDKDGKLGLMYTKVKEGETALVYGFTSSAGDFLVEPFKGTKLGWDGEPYEKTSVPEYTDIKGNWAETTILKLLENGYYLDGEKFNPSQKITQLSFLRYLYSPMQAYYNDEDFYKMLVEDKVIKENEKAPAAALTRQDAAKFVVRYLGQGKSAEHPEIFINPFKDTVTDSNKGYVAICYGLGIMKGDKNGRFNGANQVTNAEAATIIFNVLQVK